MAHNNNGDSISERLNSEIDKRVSYYEENPTDPKSKMGAVHYVAAVIIAAAGLVMTVLGAVLK